MKLNCIGCGPVLGATSLPLVRTGWFDDHAKIRRAFTLAESAKDCEGCQALWIALRTFIPNLPTIQNDDPATDFNYYRIEEGGDLLIVVVSSRLTVDAEDVALEFYRLPGKTTRKISIDR